MILIRKFRQLDRFILFFYCMSRLDRNCGGLPGDDRKQTGWSLYEQSGAPRGIYRSDAVGGFI